MGITVEERTIEIDITWSRDEGAQNAHLELEELTEQDFNLLRTRYQTLAPRAREDLKRGLVDTGTSNTQAA